MCTCSCCEDALERLKFDRVLRDACSCPGFPEPEQCDCGFCIWALSLTT